MAIDMRRIVVALVSGTFLLATSSRLPAPISEIETPTPSPDRLIKQKVKSTVRPTKADDSEESRQCLLPSRSLAL